MSTRTFTARELNQRSSVVTKAADEGHEVLITKHGKVVYRLTAIDHEPTRRSLLDAMADLPDTSEIEAEFDRLPDQGRELAW